MVLLLLLIYRLGILGDGVVEDAVGLDIEIHCKKAAVDGGGGLRVMINIL
jgi:hypothetical protein